MQCPQCGGGMTLKSGKNGPFYGCDRYPECRGTVDAKQTAVQHPQRTPPEMLVAVLLAGMYASPDTSGREADADELIDVALSAVDKILTRLYGGTDGRDGTSQDDPRGTDAEDAPQRWPDPSESQVAV